MLPDIQLGFLSHLAAVALLYAALLIPPSKLTHNKLALAFLPAIWALHIYSWSVGLGFLAAVQVLWATELLFGTRGRSSKLFIIVIKIISRKKSTRINQHRKEKRARKLTRRTRKIQSGKSPIPLTSGNVLAGSSNSTFRHAILDGISVIVAFTSHRSILS
jgi:hypothetical protein